MTFSVHGLAVSRGIAIGRAVLVASSRADVAHYFIEATCTDNEISRVRVARNAVIDEISRLQRDLPKDAPHELAALLDVQPNMPPEETLAQARIMRAQLGCARALVLVDVFGATPCNVAQKLVDGVHSKLIAGVNLPMLLRAMSYRHESLDALVARALIGATQGVMQVAVTAPQNQTLRPHDKDQHEHQQ